MNIKTLFATIAAFTVFLSVLQLYAQSPVSIVGAWQTDSGGNATTLICTENHFAMAIYDVDGKSFVGTYGGSYEMTSDGYTA